jgi:hypothetical protein
MNEATKNLIDAMPIREMLAKNRFAPLGDPYFQGETGDYFLKIMSEKRAAIGAEAWTQLSKSVGWELMSGGHFNYNQYQIGQIADEIELSLSTNLYPDDVVQMLTDTMRTLRKGQIMATRADWFLSGDDGAENYVQRLREELAVFDKQWG